MILDTYFSAKIEMLYITFLELKSFESKRKFKRTTFCIHISISSFQSLLSAKIQLQYILCAKIQFHFPIAGKNSNSVVSLSSNTKVQLHMPCKYEKIGLR